MSVTLGNGCHRLLGLALGLALSLVAPASYAGPGEPDSDARLSGAQLARALQQGGFVI